MEANIKYVNLDDLSDKEFYEKVNGHNIGEKLLNFGFFALDRRGRLITIESNPDRAYSKAVFLGCESPNILEAEYFDKKFYIEHNKRLEVAISKK
jgi:hypothetical protein